MNEDDTMYAVVEYDMSRKKEKKTVAKFFDEQKAWEYSDIHQNKFPLESPIIIGVERQ